MENDLPKYHSHVHTQVLRFSWLRGAVPAECGVALRQSFYCDLRIVYFTCKQLAQRTIHAEANQVIRVGTSRVDQTTTSNESTIPSRPLPCHQSNIALESTCSLFARLSNAISASSSVTSHLSPLNIPTRSHLCPHRVSQIRREELACWGTLHLTYQLPRTRVVGWLAASHSREVSCALSSIYHNSTLRVHFLPHVLTSHCFRQSPVYFIIVCCRPFHLVTHRRNVCL